MAMAVLASINAKFCNEEKGLAFHEDLLMDKTYVSDALARTGEERNESERISLSDVFSAESFRVVPVNSLASHPIWYQVNLTREVRPSTWG